VDVTHGCHNRSATHQIFDLLPNHALFFIIKMHYWGLILVVLGFVTLFFR